MNRIDINQLWHDPETGKYCAEIVIDGKRVASVYTPTIELILVGTLRDSHCEVWRSIRGRNPQLVP